MSVEPLFAYEGVMPPRPGSWARSPDHAHRQMPGPQGLGEAFMQLLLKELSNQDPLNPVNGADFVMQLAQLSALEQMQEMNTNLKAVLDMQQLAQATALIGRSVQATGPDGAVIEGQVMAVSLMDGVLTLDVDGLSIPMSSVFAIRGTPAEEPDRQLTDLSG